MALEIKRLHLASLTPPGTRSQWPVHGFVVTYPGGAALVDTGVGGPQGLQDDWRVVNVAAAAALAGLDMSPADITMVINTHLHFDHCGQNAVFRHAAFHVQRAELDRARRGSRRGLQGWFDFAGARFELLDGDTEILPGLSVIATPGHTNGHQSVVIQGARWPRPADRGRRLYPAAVRGTGRPAAAAGAGRRPGRLGGLDRPDPATGAARVHFCHHTDVIPA